MTITKIRDGYKVIYTVSGLRYSKRQKVWEDINEQFQDANDFNKYIKTIDPKDNLMLGCMVIDKDNYLVATYSFRYDLKELKDLDENDFLNEKVKG